MGALYYRVERPSVDPNFIRLSAGGIAGFVGNPGGSYIIVLDIVYKPIDALIRVEIIMVRFP